MASARRRAAWAGVQFCQPQEWCTAGSPMASEINVRTFSVFGVLNRPNCPRTVALSAGHRPRGGAAGRSAFSASRTSSSTYRAYASPLLQDPVAPQDFFEKTRVQGGGEALLGY